MSLLVTVRDEAAALDVSRGALRRFGLLVGGVFAVLAAVGAWRAGGVPGTAGVVFGVLGAVLLLGGLLAPQMLRAVYIVWMTAALAMGFVMTRVLLTLAFVVVFTPIGLLFRLIGRDHLHQRPDPAATSYWIERTDGPSSRERMERMY